MENVYTAYKKNVNGNECYFVKRFVVFPDIPELEPVQEGFGMHLNLEKACKIAGITSPETIAALKVQADGVPVEARVVKMRPAGLSVKISR